MYNIGLEYVFVWMYFIYNMGWSQLFCNGPPAKQPMPMLIIVCRFLGGSLYSITRYISVCFAQLIPPCILGFYM